MLMGNEPALALEDLKEVMSEEPDSIPGWIIKVDYKWITNSTFYFDFFCAGQVYVSDIWLREEFGLLA